jgi:tetratricopeptide (TPR) repeat protein
MFVSSDGRTFRQPPDGWRPGTKTPFAGTNQSLAGDLIRQGATGIAAHVAEPFLIAAIRPDVLFPAYVSGLNLAEAFYAAMPYLSWQTVVIGDPLCAPFKQKLLEQSQIEAPVDPVSELPGFYTQHRMRLPARGDVKPDAWKLFIRADYLTIRGETARARDALERATVADDRLVAGHIALASLAQARSDWDDAIARYRRVLVQSPNHIVALNDLAYILAERKQMPAEALPLAAKAYQLSKGLPVIADTLAWTQHLLGRSAEAAPIIRRTAKQLPGRVEVQWHAAVILAATGDMAGATSALDAAVKLNPAMAERFDVRSLRARLQESRK